MALESGTLVRQWATLRLIPRFPRKVATRELLAALEADGFETTKRTVERDLQSLSVIFPLVCDDREKPYGWSWQKDAPSFDIPGLSSSEALTLKLVEFYLRPLLPGSVADQLKPHFRAAEEALKKSPAGSKALWWTRKIRVVPSAQALLPPAIRAEVQSAVYDALLHDRQFEATYRKRGDARPVRYSFSPLAVVQRGAVLYLIATVFDYADIHLFALHRMSQVQVLDLLVRRPAGFDVDDYIASGALAFGDGSKIRLEALFEPDAAEHLYETPLSVDQTLKPQEDGRIRLKATVMNTPQLAWWLLGFGDAVEVLAPADLRAQFKVTVAAMSLLYRRQNLF